jgi:hypothetical protein
MATQIIEPDTAKSVMTLAGGILVFTSTAWAIVNSKLAKARSAAAKERIIGTTLGLVVIGLSVCGGLLSVFTSLRLVGAWLLIVGFMVMAFGYIRVPALPSRLETAILIVAAANSVFMFVFAIFAPIIQRIVDLLTIMSKR